MSFFASCATSEPSTNSTKEWMSDCGWMTTSIRSPGRPKRKCASMTSRPLFIIVAESIVIFGPIFQVGCASASSTVIASKVSRRRSRNGPARGGQHEAPRPRRARPQRSAWWIALCSESTGTISAPLFFASARMSSPATTSGLLVREREALAGADRRVGRAQAERADEAADDGVGVRMRRRPRRGPRGPATIRQREPGRQQPLEARDVLGAGRSTTSSGPEPRRPARRASRSSGRRRAPRPGSGPARPPTTSSAERPIEPVEPEDREGFHGATGHYIGPAPRPGRRRASYQRADEKARDDGAREEQRVDPVVEAAVAGQEDVPESLTPAPRFQSDSTRSPIWPGRRGEGAGEGARAAGPSSGRNHQVPAAAPKSVAPTRPADRALPGLLRRDDRREPVARRSAGRSSRRRNRRPRRCRKQEEHRARRVVAQVAERRRGQRDRRRRRRPSSRRRASAAAGATSREERRERGERDRRGRAPNQPTGRSRRGDLDERPRRRHEPDRPPEQRRAAEHEPPTAMPTVFATGWPVFSAIR